MIEVYSWKWHKIHDLFGLPIILWLSLERWNITQWEGVDPGVLWTCPWPDKSCASVYIPATLLEERETAFLEANLQLTKAILVSIVMQYSWQLTLERKVYLVHSFGGWWTWSSDQLSSDEDFMVVNGRWQWLQHVLDPVVSHEAWGIFH